MKFAELRRNLWDYQEIHCHFCFLGYFFYFNMVLGSIFIKSEYKEYFVNIFILKKNKN